MAGLFDDLIPQQAAPVQAAPAGGMFDDLLPKPKGETATFADRFAAAPTPQPTLAASVADAVKQLGSGLAEGAAAIPGTFPRLINLIGAGVDKILPADLIDKEKEQQAASLRSQGGPTPDEQLAAALPKPQTEAGQATRLVGQFLPSATAAPGNIIKNLVTGTAAGLGAYGGSKLAPSPETAPLFELGGALLSGAGASRLADLGTDFRRLVNPVPSASELDAAKTQLYNDPAVTGLRLKPQAGVKLADSVRAKLLQNKIDPNNAPNVMGTLNMLGGGARFEAPTTQTNTILSGPGYHIAEDVQRPGAYQVSDFDLARQTLSDVPDNERRAAAIARSTIDNYLGSIPQSDVLSGDAKAANAALLAARGNTAALKRSTEITNAMARAENQAASTYSGNLGNATRQQLRPILNQKTGVAKQQGFQDYTDQEIASLRNAANGDFLSNQIRRAKNILGAGHGLGALGTGYVGYEGAREGGYDPAQALAIGAGTALAGGGLAGLGALLERQRANAIGEMLRSRSPLAQSRGIPVGGYPAMGLLGNISNYSPNLLQAALAPYLPQTVQ